MWSHHSSWQGPGNTGSAPAMVNMAADSKKVDSNSKPCRGAGENHHENRPVLVPNRLAYKFLLGVVGGGGKGGEK